MNEVRIFVCAGEASGDLHAAALMAELKRRLAPRRVLFRGFGGDAMREVGCQLFFHTDQTSVIGFTAVLARLPFFLRMRREIQEEIDAWQPDVVITVDYPGMNLRIFDTIYHPTGLQKIAGKFNIPCANGKEMLIRQGAASFELWTGIKPDLEAMRAGFEEEITGRC